MPVHLNHVPDGLLRTAVIVGDGLQGMASHAALEDMRHVFQGNSALEPPAVERGEHVFGASAGAQVIGVAAGRVMAEVQDIGAFGQAPVRDVVRDAVGLGRFRLPVDVDGDVAVSMHVAPSLPAPAFMRGVHDDVPLITRNVASSDLNGLALAHFRSRKEDYSITRAMENYNG